jgi:uncharacterized membrane protein
MEINNLGRADSATKTNSGGNVGGVERLASVAVGSALLLWGVKRRGILPTLLGGVFLYRGAGGQCALYQAAGINTATGSKRPETSVAHGQGIKVVSSIIIDRPASEVYQYWRDLRNMPKFMSQVESVESNGTGHSHWVLKPVASKKISWDAEIINDVNGELIAWRSLPGSDIDHAGSVRFEPAPGGRGTLVKVTMEYRPPAGKLGAVAAKLFGVAPEQVVKNDLRRLKQLLEAGEISTANGSQWV